MDSQANNYDSTAIIACTDCCSYGTSSGESGGLEQVPEDIVVIINPGGSGKPNDISPCENQTYQIAQIEGEILSNGQSISEEC